MQTFGSNSPSASWWPEDCAYVYTSALIRGIPWYLGTQFDSQTVMMVAAMGLPSGPIYLSWLWNNGDMTSADIDAYIANLTKSMAGVMRARGDGTRSSWA